MNETTWLPGIVVLVAGLIVGLTVVVRLRGAGTKKAKKETPDLDLKIRDLEARRDDLYRRLRAADEDHLGPQERSALEGAAARTLRELDQLSGQLPKAVAKKRAQAREVAADPEPAATPTRGRRPLLTGFAFGAAMVAVISLLVYWAVRDAQPTGQTVPPPTEMGGTMEPPHEGQIQVPAEVAGQITDLQNRLVNDPEDWMARKQLALSYVAAGEFFEAFNQASQVLQQFPEDPDGLLVHGIVRLTMGQADQAVDLFDRVLAQYPDHRQALVYRGLALYQSGSVEQALDTWDMGLQMAGGSDAELEELIEMARSGASQPAGMVPPAPPPIGETAPQEAVAAAPAQLDPDSFSVQIEIAAGAQVAPQATLFVFLRPAAGGPPVAARRITVPKFPLQITLSTDDSMMGDELPDSGVLVARLDLDGSVTTTDASDLAAETTATKGELTRLTLGHTP